MSGVSYNQVYTACAGVLVLSLCIVSQAYALDSTSTRRLQKRHAQSYSLNNIIPQFSVRAPGIHCLKCNSMIEGAACRLGFVKSHQCPPESKACSTFVGIMENPDEHFVIRDCSDKPAANFCQGHGEHKFCVFHCYGASCNQEAVDAGFNGELENSIY